MKSPHVLRFGLAGLLLGVFLLQAPAQGNKPPAKDGAPPARGGGKKDGAADERDYRQFFRTPTTPSEFWDAMQFEIDVGRYDLAANHLRGLLALNPSDADLVAIADRVGIAAFLRLRNIPKWSDDPKADAAVRKSVADLIKRVTEAVHRSRTDPEKIKFFIKNLTASPEENAFALQQLYKAGAAAVPYLIDAIRSATGEERATLLDALRRLGPDTVPPTVAALDSQDPELQVELIRILQSRGALAAIPTLWHLSGDPRQPEQVQRDATRALSALLNLPAGKLPAAKFALTQEAERYYQHRVKFSNPQAVVVWRWDGKRVVQGWPGATTIPADQAEEYYGLRYAGQALAIDPGYRPAQIVLLSLALEKAQQKAGPGQSLEKTAPAVRDLLATVDPALLVAVLDRAMKEHRVLVILGAVRALGARDEVRGNVATEAGPPPLVRAMYYPDRRVQMAAAEALLRVPDSAASQATARVVDIFRRSVAGEPEARAPAKVLVAYFDPDMQTRVMSAVRAAGFEPVPVRTGREAMQRLRQAADIALIVADAELPDPGLPQFLGQLRADVDARRLPIVLSVPPERAPALRQAESDYAVLNPPNALPQRVDALRRHVARWPNISVVRASAVVRADTLEPLLRSNIAASGPPLSDAEARDFAERSVRHLAQLSRGEPPGYDVRPAGPAVLEALRVPTRLTPEGQIAAIEVVSRMKGAEPQRELANVVLQGQRPLSVRVVAANALVHHIQRYSPLLTREFVVKLETLHADPAADPPLRASVALALGSMRRDAQTSGERLLQYQPPTPGQPMPPPKKE
jgi:CheY-like chemotaxis protein